MARLRILFENLHNKVHNSMKIYKSARIIVTCFITSSKAPLWKLDDPAKYFIVYLALPPPSGIKNYIAGEEGREERRRSREGDRIKFIKFEGNKLSRGLQGNAERAT